MAVERLTPIDWAPWKAGPLEDFGGPILVSLTDFRYRTAEDRDAAAEIGLELRRTWPVLHGALGLCLWSARDYPRAGSVAVWQSAEDLRRFVRWPVHAAIMSAWRDRGTVVSCQWEAPSFDPVAVLARAERHLHHPKGNA